MTPAVLGCSRFRRLNRLKKEIKKKLFQLPFEEYHVRDKLFAFDARLETLGSIQGCFPRMLQQVLKDFRRYSMNIIHCSERDEAQESSVKTLH